MKMWQININKSETAKSKAVYDQNHHQLMKKLTETEEIGLEESRHLAIMKMI